MHARLRRPAVALLTTTLAAAVLGVAPSAYAADSAVLTGIVSNAQGAGIEDVQVGLYEYDDTFDEWVRSDLGTSTGPTGAYSLNVPLGTYKVGFDDTSGDYVDHGDPPGQPGHSARRPAWARRRNSSRVFESSRKMPLSALVTAREFCFSTPRIIMQKWAASITTPTPVGRRTFMMASAISSVRRS